MHWMPTQKTVAFTLPVNMIVKEQEPLLGSSYIKQEFTPVDVAYITPKDLYTVLSDVDKGLVDGLLAGIPHRVIGTDNGKCERTVKQQLSLLSDRLNVKQELGYHRSIQMGLMFLEVLELEQQLLPYTFERFAPRELLVLRYCATGMMNKYIGYELKTTEQVIKNYTRVIFDKTGTNSRMEAILWYEAHRTALGEPLREKQILRIPLSCMGEYLAKRVRMFCGDKK